jgi:hypothetical protein
LEEIKSIDCNEDDQRFNSSNEINDTQRPTESNLKDNLKDWALKVFWTETILEAKPQALLQTLFLLENYPKPLYSPFGMTITFRPFSYHPTPPMPTPLTY